MRARAAALVAFCALAGCGGAADDGEPAECERSEYELERTRYRCTAAAELQTLDCGEWVTVEVCIRYGGARAPEACSPGPEAGCD